MIDRGHISRDQQKVKYNPIPCTLGNTGRAEKWPTHRQFLANPVLDKPGVKSNIMHKLTGTNVHMQNNSTDAQMTFETAMID